MLAINFQRPTLSVQRVIEMTAAARQQVAPGRAPTLQKCNKRLATPLGIYWGEVREEGIMPALPRNYYGGFEIFF